MDRRRVGKPPTCYSRAHSPSFSSSLLDAIYRSMDGEDGSHATADHRTRGPPDSALRLHIHNLHGHAAARSVEAVTRSAHDFRGLSAVRGKADNGSTRPSRRLGKGWTAEAVSDKAVTRSRVGFSDATARPVCGPSCNGLSSSDEPEWSIRPNRIGPIRTGPSSVRSGRTRFDAMEEEKKMPGSAPSRLKPPASPGARLASFFSSLFVPAGHPKKTKSSAMEPGRGKRSLRPVAGEDSRPTGRRGGDATAAAVREARRRVEEIVATRRFEAADDVASDASSDLFELEDLAIGGRYKDELPVYASTNLNGDLFVFNRSRVVSQLKNVGGDK